MQKTDSLEAYSVTFLRHKDHFLLLQRNPDKQFAPGRWTGLGGHVEMDEYSQLRSRGAPRSPRRSGYLATRYL